MQVTVKLHGALGPGGRGPVPGPFDFALPEHATAGDLMRELALRVGKPFGQALASPDARLPRSLRIFADGEMVLTRDQPLAPPGASHAGVTVVVMSPVAGGA